MKTYVIGLDGATYTVLDQMVERGLMPNLKRFYDEGVRSILHSTPIPITPQAWTSMATGRGAGHHGLADFVRFEIGKNAFVRLNDATDNHCEWLWKYLSRKGRTVTVLNWFGIAPPVPVNGRTMPGFTSARHLKRSSYPPDLVPRLREAMPDLDTSVLGLNRDIERKGLTQLDKDEWLEWINHHTDREAAWYEVFSYLDRNEPADFTALVFDGVDKLSHLAYPYIDTDTAPETPNEWQQAVIESCNIYFKAVDEFIGGVLEHAGEGSRVFIASDHGFTSSRYTFYVNRALEDAGFLEWRAGTKTEDSGEYWNESLGADANQVDVEKSRAFCLSPGANGVYVRARDGEDEAELTQKVIDALLAVETPDGTKMVTAVDKRDDVLPGPFKDRIPELLVRLSDFGFVSVLRGVQPVTKRPELHGTHHPDGVLLGLGAGLKAGATVDSCEIVDVAALLAHSVGEESDPSWEGTFPAHLYDEAYLEQDPHRVGTASSESAEGELAAVGDVTMDAEEEKMVMERLRSLGYIE